MSHVLLDLTDMTTEISDLFFSKWNPSSVIILFTRNDSLETDRALLEVSTFSTSKTRRRDQERLFLHTRTLCGEEEKKEQSRGRFF